MGGGGALRKKRVGGRKVRCRGIASGIVHGRVTGIVGVGGLGWRDRGAWGEGRRG